MPLGTSKISLFQIFPTEFSFVGKEEAFCFSFRNNL
jgi:hypothetical protein